MRNAPFEATTGTTTRRKGARQRALTAASFALLGLLSGSLLLTTAGCGSGGGGRSLAPAGAESRARGTATFTVVWPERSGTRVIPAAANSIVLTLTRVTPGPNIQAVVPQVLKRPAAGQPLVTTATFGNLELGGYTVTATAYPDVPTVPLPTPVSPNAAQAGGPQPGSTGSATTPLQINAGANTLTLTMFATVKSVVVTRPDAFSLRINGTRQYTATAYDGPNGTGNVVITQISGTQPAIVWTSSNAAIATVNSSGLVTARGFGAGTATATITATYTEPGTASGVEGTGSAGTSTITVVDTGLSTTAPWAKFHGNAQNTGQATQGADATGTLAFSPLALGGSVVFTSPVVAADGTIYVGSYDNNLYAINPNGTVKWKFLTGGIIESTPLISRDGTIYFGSFDGKFYAIRDTGTAASTVWTFTAGGPIFGSANIDAAGYLYFGATNPDTKVYKVDSLNGLPVWTFGGSNDGIQTTPALNSAGDTVYVGSLNGSVYAITASTGAQRWTAATGGAIYSSSPAVATISGVESVFVGSLDNKMYAFPAAAAGTATPLWTFDSGAPVYTSPAVSTASSTVYFANFDNVTGFDNNSQVFALNAGSGTTRWATATGRFTDGFTSSPSISASGTQLYLGCYDGNIYGLRTTDGTNAWTPVLTAPPAGQTTNNFDSSPGIGANGTFYIGGLNRNIYGIR